MSNETRTERLAFQQRKNCYPEPYKTIVTDLYHSRDPISARYWKKALGIHARRVGECVRHARRCGHPIGSNAKGYYMEFDRVKIMDQVKALRSRALDIMETASLLHKAAVRRQHTYLWGRMQRKEIKAQTELNV